MQTSDPQVTPASEHQIMSAYLQGIPVSQIAHMFHATVEEIEKVIKQNVRCENCVTK